jgi:DNA-binding IclR family transcriptional regulator
MRALHKLTGQTVNLSVRQGDEIVYIDRAYSERSGMQVVRAIGGRAPLHLTSVGKLFLADDDSVKLKSYVSKTGLNGHTQNSISDLAQLEKELDLVKSLGHARDDEELELGVSCMAAAILDDTGKLVAGLSLSAPTERMQDDWLKSLKDTAMQISKSLGYKPPSLKSS